MSLSIQLPPIFLCGSVKEYRRVLTDNKLKPDNAWLGPLDGSDACNHTCTGPDGKLFFIVCLTIPAASYRDGIDVATLLVHEAVHIWQRTREHYGESEPGREIEAYSIQSISAELMRKYARRVINA